MSSVFGEFLGAICCCLPVAAPAPAGGRSRDLKRLSDWRAHPTLRQYDLEKHLADGGFSEIWLVRQRNSRDLAVVKVVNLRRPGLRAEDAEVLRGEAKMLRNRDHPALLRCMDVFETKYHLVMILEYLSGGEMLEHLHRVEHYSEREAARLFAQVAGAVAYLHNLNIVHRDIKPENVLFARPVEECVAACRPLRVKLIDMGMANVLPPPPLPPPTTMSSSPKAAGGEHCEQSLLLGSRGGGGKGAGKRGGKGKGGAAARPAPSGCLGSPGFIAPEVIRGGPHTLAMDVFSLGVLLFVMLVGRKPWALKDVRSLAYAKAGIRTAPGLKDAGFLALSQAARELLLAMLADDPRDRPSAAAVLRHPFIRAALASPGGAGGGGVPGGQRELDVAIKRRIAQLALLRRYRGLSFAMMSSRAEGQRQSEFVSQVAERRKALHRDFITRARARHAVRRQTEEMARWQHQDDISHHRRPRSSDRGTALSPAGPQAHASPGRAQAQAHAHNEARAASMDSVASKEPLLSPSHPTGRSDDPHHHHHLLNHHHASPGPDPGSTDSPDYPAYRRLNDGSHAGSPGAGPAPPGFPPRYSLDAWAPGVGPRPMASSATAEPRPVSLDSASSSAIGGSSSSRLPLLPLSGQRQTAGHDPSLSPGRPPLPPSHAPPRVTVPQQVPYAVQPHVHMPRQPQLSTVAEPGEDATSSLGAAAKAKPPLPLPPGTATGRPFPNGTAANGAPAYTAPSYGSTANGMAPPSAVGAGPGAGAAASGLRSRGWSSSGTPGSIPSGGGPYGSGSGLGPSANASASGAAVCPAPYPSRRLSGPSAEPSNHGTGPGSSQAGGWRGSLSKSRRFRGSELELTALDPLALIRDLPGGGCGMGALALGRAHSAPESAAAAEAAWLDAMGGLHACGGGDRRGGGGRGGGGGGRMDPAAALLQQVVMGADMRAFSANSWTLELLENEEMLAALTGIDLRRRHSASTASGGGTIHDGNLYTGANGAATAATALSAALSAALDGLANAGIHWEAPQLPAAAHYVMPSPSSGGGGGGGGLPGSSGPGAVLGSGSGGDRNAGSVYGAASRGGSTHGGASRGAQDPAAAAAAAAFASLARLRSGASTASIASGTPADSTVHASSQAAALLAALTAAAGASSAARRRTRDAGPPPAASAAAVAALAALGTSGGGGGGGGIDPALPRQRSNTPGAGGWPARSSPIPVPHHVGGPMHDPHGVAPTSSSPFTTTARPPLPHADAPGRPPLPMVRDRLHPAAASAAPGNAFGTTPPSLPTNLLDATAPGGSWGRLPSDSEAAFRLNLAFRGGGSGGAFDQRGMGSGDDGMLLDSGGVGSGALGSGRDGYEPRLVSFDGAGHVTDDASSHRPTPAFVSSDSQLPAHLTPAFYNPGAAGTTAAVPIPHTTRPIFALPDSCRASPHPAGIQLALLPSGQWAPDASTGLASSLGTGMGAASRLSSVAAARTAGGGGGGGGGGLLSGHLRLSSGASTSVALLQLDDVALLKPAARLTSLDRGSGPVGTGLGGGGAGGLGGSGGFGAVEEEEQRHGGDMWLRRPGALAATMASAAAAMATHLAGGGGGSEPSGTGLGAGPAMPSPPSVPAQLLALHTLERISEGPDGLFSGRSATTQAAAASAGPTGASTDSGDGAFGSARAAAASAVSDAGGRSCPQSATAGAAQRWRSPFEALASAPVQF